MAELVDAANQTVFTGTILGGLDTEGEALNLGGGAIIAAGAVEIDGALNHDGTTVGFYNTTPIAKQTGVAVSAAGVHAALVALGLIAA